MGILWQLAGWLHRSLIVHAHFHNLLLTRKKRFPLGMYLTIYRLKS
jgi:hypothetical protein